MKHFTGFWALLTLDLTAFIFLIYWWASDGFDPLRDGLMIGIFGAINITLFLTQKK